MFMRKKRILSALALVFCFVLSVTALAYNGGVTVYKAPHGECYHREDCSYLGSCSAMTLEEAVNANLRPCSRCDPPVLGVDRDTDTEPYHRPTSRDSSSSSGVSSSAPKSSSSSSSGSHFAAKVADSTAGLDYILYGFLGFIALIWIAGGAVAIRDRVMYKKDKAKYQALYGGKAIEELVDIPTGCVFGNDGFPRDSNAKGETWGDTFTFWRSASGNVYHGRYGCSGAKKPVNAITLYRQKNYRPCRRCNPSIPNVEWAVRASEIKMLKKRYEIE